MARGDFTLTDDAMGSGGFAPVMRRPETVSPDGATPDAPDPTGVPGFLEAVQKQLGVKVETSKRPQKVLVIDHMLEDPVEN